MASTRRSVRLQEHGVKSMKDDSESEDEELEKEDKENSDDENEEEPTGADPPAKRQKVQKTATTNGPSRPAASRQRAPPKRAKPDAGKDLNDLSLLEILCKHPEAIVRAAKEWIEDYKEDKADAMARLMTLVAQTAGCEEPVTKDEAEENEVEDLVKKMAEYVIKHSCVDPLHEKRLRGFRSALQQFWARLISAMYTAELVLEDYIVERLSGMVIALSCSPVRLFRLGGTQTASYLMAGWVGVQALMSRDLSQTQFQAEAEGKKKAPNKKLLDSLKRQTEQQHRRINDLDAAAKNLITAIFAMRFRDCWAEVRLVVINSFAAWMKAAPQSYLADANLKYLGWALSDKDPGVRLEAVSGVTALYHNKDNVLGLHGFKTRFESRFLEMVRDVDEQVAVKALELLSLLVDANELDAQLLKEDVYEMMTDPSPPLRQGAAKLVSRLLLDAAAQRDKETGLGSAPSQGKRQTKAGKAAAAAAAAAGSGAAAAAGSGGGSSQQEGEEAALSPDCQLACLLDLMELLQQSPSFDGAAGLMSDSAGPSSSSASTKAPLSEESVRDLVDALHEHLPVLSDWRCMLSALLDDSLLEPRGRSGALHLALLLAATVERLTTAPAPAKKQGRQQAAGAARGASKAAGDVDPVQELSLELVTKLPKLLGKHQSEAGVASALISLLPHLQLEVYSLRQDERGFGVLLQQVSEQLFRHADAEPVMVRAVDALVYCVGSGPGSLQPAAQLALSEAVTRAAGQLVAAAQAVQSLGKEELGEEVGELEGGRAGEAGTLFGLKCALLRVNVLLLRGASAMATHTQVYEALRFLMEDSLGLGRQVGPAVTALALSSMQATLGWALVRAGGGRGDRGAAVADLQQRLAQYLQQVCALSALCEEEGGEGGEEEQERERERVAMRGVLLEALSLAMVTMTGEAWKGTAVEGAAVEGSDEVVRKLWALGQQQLEWFYRSVQACEQQQRGAAAGVGEDDDPIEGDTQEQQLAAAAATGGGGDSAELAEARAGLLRSAGQLAAVLCSPCLEFRHFRWLAAHMASSLTAFGPEAEELAREALRHCRKRHPAAMAEVYVGAMKLAYIGVTEAGGGGGEEAGGRLRPALQDFSDLCKKLASLYAGHNLLREELVRIVKAGLVFALSDAPAKLHFAAWGLGHFTNKLAQEDAVALAAEVQDTLQGLEGYDPEGEAWAPVHQYLAGLQERGMKGKAAKGALKGSKKEAGGKQARRISFAAAHEEGIEEGEEEGEGQVAKGRKGKAGSRGGRRKAAEAQEEEEEHGAMEEEQAQPKQQQVDGARSRGRRAAQDEEEQAEEAEVPLEPLQRKTRPQRQKQPTVQAVTRPGKSQQKQKQQEAEEEEEQEGEGEQQAGEGEQQAVPVVPAQKQGQQKEQQAAQAGAKSHKRKPQPQEEEEEGRPGQQGQARKPEQQVVNTFNRRRKLQQSEEEGDEDDDPASPSQQQQLEVEEVRGRRVVGESKAAAVRSPGVGSLRHSGSSSEALGGSLRRGQSSLGAGGAKGGAGGRRQQVLGSEEQLPVRRGRSAAQRGKLEEVEEEQAEEEGQEELGEEQEMELGEEAGEEPEGEQAEELDEEEDERVDLRHAPELSYGSRRLVPAYHSLSHSDKEAAQPSCSAIQEASQISTGGVEPPPRAKRRRRV